MVTSDSFSLHGFIDCFNHHNDHAALLGNMILEKVYFRKSSRTSKYVSIYIFVFSTESRKMFNNNTI